MKVTKRTSLVPGMLILAISGFMIACTKEVPYKYEYKEKVHNKSDVDTTAEYLYVPSSDLTNHDDSGAAGARPYWQGNETIVKFRFTEKSLQAVQVDDESRLKDNGTNEKIVFDIPVQHVQYRCAEDRYKKCTNKEEENNEIPWNKKSQFKPEFESLKTIAVNLLPVEMDQVFGDSCYAETSSRFLGYELTADAINIQVEKNFKGDASCLSQKGINISNLGDLNSQIVYHYSFTKMSAIASPGYKALSYPVSDEGIFGFFTTDTRHYDVAYNRLEKNKLQFMNRWNPERKEIDYYLTDNFDKPEFAAIKKATQKAFDRINAGLQSANINFRVNLKGTDHKSPGDIRNSMIVLVEDPVASGPLGYGPVAANPRTGEIMSARVAMYYGNLLQGIKMTYDEVVRESRRQQSKLAAFTVKLESDQAESNASSTSVLGQAAADKNAAKKMQKRMVRELMKNFRPQQAAQSAKVSTQSKYTATQFTASDLTKMSKRDFERSMLVSDKTTKAKDVLTAMSKYCNYPSDFFPFNEAVKVGLQGKLGKNLKLWKDLSETEKQTAIDLIAPEIWVPTLVHELGHNLGLRHNFAGSEDKDNFYTPEELQKMGINHKVPYSSVMDYGYSELNVLPTLGKYDIAALRFGYKREVEMTDGKIQSLEKLGKSLGQMQAEARSQDKTAPYKDFSYCSDEHVEVNPNCKRFDEGTSWPEIVDFMEKSYNDMYLMRNFRNGRENFSKMSDGAYANATRGRFAYVRAFMERYEGIKHKFKLTDDSKEWTEVPFLKDIKEAYLKSGRFFMRVLQTPDIQCAVAKEDNPNQVVAIEELSNISADADQCFGLKLINGYKVVGQTGKAFNNKKDPESDNHYADQIDVRGIYADKIAAAEFLFKRRIGNSSYDVFEDNYLDGELFPEIMQTVFNVFLTTPTQQATFVDENGLERGTLEIRNRMFSAPDDTNNPELNSGKSLTHWIEAPLEPEIAQSIGMPNRKTSLQEVILGVINSSLKRTQTNSNADRDQLEIFQVVKTSKAYQLSSDLKGVALDVGATRYVALPENGMAMMSIQSAKVATLLGKLKQDELEALYNEAIAQEAQEAAAKASAPAATAAAPTSKFGPEYQQISSQEILAFARKEMSAAASTYLLSLLPASN